MVVYIHTISLHVRFVLMFSDIPQCCILNCHILCSGLLPPRSRGAAPRPPATQRGCRHPDPRGLALNLNQYMVATKAPSRLMRRLLFNSSAPTCVHRL